MLLSERTRLGRLPLLLLRVGCVSIADFRGREAHVESRLFLQGRSWGWRRLRNTVQLYRAIFFV